MCALYGITTFLNLNKVQDLRLDEHLYVYLNYLVQDFGPMNILYIYRSSLELWTLLKSKKIIKLYDIIM